MRLKKKECCKCPQCNKIYFENSRIKDKLCTICKIPTQRETYFTRLRVERYAFIYTLSLILSLSMFFGVNWETAKAGPGNLVFLFLIVLPGLLMGIYHMINEYLSGAGGGLKNTKKELNIFKEIYFSNNKPTEEEMAFSWPKYFNEVIHFVGILIIFVFLGAGVFFVGKFLN